MRALIGLGIFAVSINGCGKSCPDLSGNWEITQHCVEDLVGQAIAFEQDDCGITTNGAFAGFEGAVEDNGAFSVGGTFEGAVVNCTGNAGETRVTLNCTGDCDVVFEKR